MTVLCDGVEYENDYTQYKPGVDRKLVVDDIISSLNIKGIRQNDGAKLLWYDGGVFRDKPDTRIKGKVLELLKDNYKINEVRELLSRLSADDRVLVDEYAFDNDIDKICLMNGTYSIKERVMLETTPEQLNSIRLPVWYDANAKCDPIVELISRLLENEDNIKTMQEFFGFCLLRDYKYKHMFILLGPRDTGKTTIMNVLMNMLGTTHTPEGTENVSNVLMHDLCGENPFHRVKLYKKLLNYGDDLPEKAIEDTSLIKAITGRGWIDAERKHLDSIRFMSFAKQAYSCNAFPYVKGDKESFLGRVILLMCEHILSSSEMIPHIESTLYGKDNMSGLFNWSLEGLYRLLENNHFTSSKRSEEMKNLCLRKMEPIRGFIEDCIILDVDGKIRMPEMYEAYKMWCEEAGVVVLDNKKFYPRFEAKIPSLRRGKHRFNRGPSEVCFCGVRLKSEYDIGYQNELVGPKAIAQKDEHDRGVFDFEHPHQNDDVAGYEEVYEKSDEDWADQ